MNRLVERDGKVVDDADRAAVEGLLDDGGFFWLDLRQPTEEELGLLRETFRFHPLAIEDSIEFGQRAKLEEYDDFVFLVVFGWAPDEDGLVEVHCFFSEECLVTVRRDAAPAIDELLRRYRHGAELGPPIRVLYHVIDGLVDSFFRPLNEIDERIDAIQDGLLTNPSNAELQELTSIRRRLVGLRRVVGPERDMLGRVAGGVATLPGMSAEAERFFRDIYDHLIRLSETIDGYRDLSSSAMDVYLSSSSNRLNEVMKQLTLVATIFLPLSFVTGYFGQNFAWLVRNVGGLGAFLVLGVILDLACVGALAVWFRRRGWV
ncbi:MAG TPA: magnesium/cobalt transporter CorA [Gaiellaceae bacterium]